jgi:hypothetical protein
MDIEGLLVPLGVFAAVVAVFGLVTGLIGHWVTNNTLREALRTSPENVALVANKLQQRRPVNTETWGLLGIALGAALAGAGLIGAPETRVALLQAALLPGFIGGALFGQRWLPARKSPPAIDDLRAG